MPDRGDLDRVDVHPPVDAVDPDPGEGVLRQPPAHLGAGPVHRRVQRRRHVVPRLGRDRQLLGSLPPQAALTGATRRASQRTAAKRFVYAHQKSGPWLWILNLRQQGMSAGGEVGVMAGAGPPRVVVQGDDRTAEGESLPFSAVQLLQRAGQGGRATAGPPALLGGTR